jgi:sugar phosphate isomerase/epimerase
MLLPLSISLAGLEPDERAPWMPGPRAAIHWVAAAGCRWVQLDAAAAGIRPRDLDRSGRRDLAALLRRTQLRLSGLDLWIPAEHFADAAKSERALDAVLGAIDLAADLRRLAESAGAAVSIALPVAPLETIRSAIAAHAQSRGIDVADHTMREGAALDPLSPVGAGLDPAAALLAGRDPPQLALAAGRSLKSARLSDASAVGRVAVGDPRGRLDVVAYEAALAAAGYQTAVVVDLRGVAQQQAAAERLFSNGLRLGDGSR